MAANGDNKDWFGIPKIYADYPGRNSWHITDTNDSRLMEDVRITKRGDGWYVPPPKHNNEFRLECVSDSSVVDSNGNAKPGEDIIDTFSLPKVIGNGYLYRPVESKDNNGNPNGDFGDMEITWRFKVSDNKGEIELVPGGLRQTGDTNKVGKDKAVPACCEAMSYHFKLEPSTGRARFEKDTDHKDGGSSRKPVGYADHAFERSGVVSPFVAKEVIHKAVLYRVGQDSMKLEHYFDETGTGNHLRKILECTDNSDWGPTRGYTYLGADNGNKECRGNDESFEKKALTAARVAIGFRFDGNLNDFVFKDCSVRSIDPSKRINPAALETPPAPESVPMHF